MGTEKPMLGVKMSGIQSSPMMAECVSVKLNIVFSRARCVGLNVYV